CANCNCHSTPSWRRNPLNHSQCLCNACGLYYKLHKRMRPFRITEDGSVKVQRNSQTEPHLCCNCSTTQTPLWRRGKNNEILCNRCGLYYKQHGRHRPIQLSRKS
ncbi:iron transporter biosynthesis regulating transcription factor, partial [Rozella allomycis CSF55]